jgi:putative transposase
VLITTTFLGDPVVRSEFSQSDPEVQRKLRSASALVQRFLSPDPIVNLLCEELGVHWRDRVYGPMITFWMFINQVISADKSCQMAVGRLNAWRLANGLAKVSSKTTAFCKARARLPELIFERLLEIVAKRCEQVADEFWLWHGRIVEMVDGWTVTMADTPENQAEYPQMANQKTGCGFPIARMIGLFSLAIGAANRVAIAAYQGKQTGETSLLRSIPHLIVAGRRSLLRFVLVVCSRHDEKD